MPQRYKNTDTEATAKQKLDAELNNYIADTDALDAGSAILTLLMITDPAELTHEERQNIGYTMRLLNSIARVQKDNLKMRVAM